MCEFLFRFLPHCETFYLLPSPPIASNSSSGRLTGLTIAARSDNSVLALGGLNVVNGSVFSFIHCTYELQEFQSNVDQQMYKSGHSKLVTRISVLGDTPVPSTKVFSVQANG